MSISSKIKKAHLYTLPDDIAMKVEPVLQKLNQVLSHPPDFPHDSWHADAVTRDVRYATYAFNMSKEEIVLAKDIAQVHDEGYRLVSAGVLSPEEHHFGSYLAALFKFGDEVIAQGALLHNQDVLPEDAPTAFWLVRDIDRIHFLGWGGVIRASYYLGFRPFGMSGYDPKKIEKTLLLFEDRTPDEERVRIGERLHYCSPWPPTIREEVLHTDFERRAKIYSWLHIFPFLFQFGKLDDLKDSLQGLLMDWQEGQHYYQTPGNHFVPEGEEYDSDKIIYTVEPIEETLQHIFGARFFNTYDAIGAIDAWKELHPDGILRKPKLEKQWSRETHHPYMYESPSYFRISRQYVLRG